ncbi:MAG: ShlB/FhaC/HecB family hemolysin secretion/activation protein [Verrucomicrobiota bacterium]
MKWKITALYLCSGLFGLCTVQVTYAQANNPANPAADLVPRFRSIAPKEDFIKEEKVEEPEQEEEEVAPPHAEDVLVEKMTGLIIHDAMEDVILEYPPNEPGLMIDATLLIKTADFKEMTDKYIGQPVTLDSLDKLIDDIREFYKDKDFPVVDVAIPEQEISEGTVQIVIIEGRLGKIVTEGNRWFGKDLLLRNMRLEQGERIKKSVLVDDIRYLNQNPFRDIDVVFEKGENYTETDIVLSTIDRLPFRFFFGYEDSGNDLTDDERWLAGFNWGNAFFADHLLSYQTTVSPDLNGLRAHAATYTIPFFRTHELTFLGSYSSSSGDFLNSGVKFESTGVSWQVGARYSFPLSDPQDEHVRQRLTLGYDFKQTNNRFDSLGSQTSGNWIDVSQLMFAYNLSQQDDLGYTLFGFQTFYSPGNFTHNNRDEFFNQNRSQSGASYTYINSRTQRVVYLPWDFRASGIISFQFADKNLASTEQLRLGGYDSVRGYDEDEVRGDEGWLVNLELQMPAISITKLFGHEALDDELRFHGFWDYGVAGATVPLEGLTPADNENPDIELSAVGMGLRYSLENYLTLRADYGFQLIDTGLNSRHSGRWHIGVVVSY